MNRQIVPLEEYRECISKNYHHIVNLKEIVERSGELLEGDCLYQHQTTNMLPELVNKQRNIFTLAKSCNKILEIGLNAGHSALLMLLANPNAILYCFDICDHRYTKLCFQYLYENFGGRVMLYEGDSNVTVPMFMKEACDLYHIDGSNDYYIANIDFYACRALSKFNSIVIFDDVNMSHLRSLWDKYVSSKHVHELTLLDTSKSYEHAIGIFL